MPAKLILIIIPNEITSINHSVWLYVGTFKLGINDTDFPFDKYLPKNQGWNVQINDVTIQNISGSRDRNN